MSTILRLRELQSAGELERWHSPLMPLASVRRAFFVTRRVKEKLEEDPWNTFLESAASAQRRRVHTHVMINQFVEGQAMVVGRGDQDCDLKCLQPMERVADWRVWEMRPWPQKRFTRVLGVFAGEDTFVAMKCMPRLAIVDWDKEMGAVDGEWHRLFESAPPLRWSHCPKAKDIGKNFDDFEA